MKRRDFLRATLITVGAAALPACGGTDTETNPTPTETIEDGSKFFPQSVASGDPRADSVVLWARIEDADATGDVDLEIQVATDEKMEKLVSLGDGAKVKALSKYDGCAKAKIKGLDPATVYYYRFVYKKASDSKKYGSRIARTKTAPEATADVTVKFAYVSCQDYIGRFYNSYVALAAEELDFFVHLGDYIYETTGDPSFQSTSGRAIAFSDVSGAIELQSGKGEKYYAAKSLSNYRQLYRTYRSDKSLQAVHERFPMIATWDDHEFSDDCHGDVACYFDGQKDEKDETRRKAADQAWFEYQPVDYPDGESFAYDPAVAFPGDIKIWRDFVFGKNVHLVMTDLRTRRADHLIPEDGFPGTVVVDEPTLVKELGSLPADATPYIDVETYLGGLYKQVLTAAADTAGFAAAKITGKMSAGYINAFVTKLNEGLDPSKAIPLIDLSDLSKFERGYAYVDMAKASFYGSIGSRYLVNRSVFQTVSKIAYKASKDSGEVMGAEQEAWFLKTMKDSTATWKIWGNEYPFGQIAIDLSSYPLPDAFKHAFLMDCDAWDGFQEKKEEMITALSAIPGAVIITGDIHAFFAGTPASRVDPTKKIVELVGGAISSGTYKFLLKSQIAADPNLSAIPAASLLVDNIDGIFKTSINSHLGFSDSDSNGYVTVEASGKELLATYNTLPSAYVEKEMTADQIKPGKVKFRVVPGENELYQDFSGTWKKWDPKTQLWV